VEVQTVWITGDNSESIIPALNEKFSNRVVQDPDIATAEGWAVSVTNLPKKLTSNMIPWYVQQRPMRRLILRLGFLFSLLLLALTIATVVSVEYLVRADHISDDEIAQKASFQAQIASWQQQKAQLNVFQQRLQAYGVLGQPPAPMLMLRYLGAVQPQGVLVHRAVVTSRGRRSADGEAIIHFALHGEAGNSPNQGLALLHTMERNLAQPPLVARITQHGEESWKRAVVAGSANLLAKPLHFLVQGDSR